MQISFVFRQFEGTDDLKKLITEKVRERLGGLLDGKDADVRVTIATEKAWTVLDFFVTVSGKVFKCTEKTTEIYPTIDLALDKLERQMRKSRQRVREIKRRAKTQ
jgi:putative sigma-54 modulation protein